MTTSATRIRRSTYRSVSAWCAQRNPGHPQPQGDLEGHRRDGAFQPLHWARKMTIIFDGPPGTKLGEGEVDGMHELLAADDFPVWELELDDEDEELTKAADATLSTAEAAERKVADRI